MTDVTVLQSLIDDGSIVRVANTPNHDWALAVAVRPKTDIEAPLALVLVKYTEQFGSQPLAHTLPADAGEERLAFEVVLFVASADRLRDRVGLIGAAQVLVVRVGQRVEVAGVYARCQCLGARCPWGHWHPL